MKIFRFIRGLFNLTSFVGILIIGGVTAWMFVIPAPAKPEQEVAAAAPLQTVEIRNIKQTERTLTKQYEGITRASESLQFYTKASGTVTSIVSKNTVVAAGDILVEVVDPVLDQSLATLEQDLELTVEDIRKNKVLLDRGIIVKSRVDDLKLKKSGLEENITRIEEQKNNLVERAPFAGIVSESHLLVDQRARAGVHAVTVVALDPILVEFSIPQNDLEFVFDQTRAEISILGKTGIEGSIDFISKIATNTRQFEAEVTVDNPGNDFPAGLTAEVTIPYETRLLTYIPASYIVLDENTGDTGVKVTVDYVEYNDTTGDTDVNVTVNSVVEFLKIEIVESDENGFFVAGLEDNTNIISLGQGFVKAGERVNPVLAGE